MGIVEQDMREIILSMISDAKYRILKNEIYDERECEPLVSSEIIEQQLEKLTKRISQILSN